MSAKRTSRTISEGGATVGQPVRSVRVYGKAGVATSINGTRKSKARQIPTSQEDEVVVSEEALSSVRDASLAVKQSELDATYNVHDDYVRQLFHLQSFGNMLGFDPQEAKEDGTAVFKEFKEPYDLIGKTVPTTGTRRTRGAISQVLSSAPILIPTISTPVATSKVKKRRQHTSATWDIIAEAHKAREQYEANRAAEQPTDELEDLGKEAERSQSETENRKTRRKGKEKVDATETRPDQPRSPPALVEAPVEEIVEDVTRLPLNEESISVVIARKNREFKRKEEVARVHPKKTKKLVPQIEERNGTLRVSPRKVLNLVPSLQDREKEDDLLTRNETEKDVTLTMENQDSVHVRQKEMRVISLTEPELELEVIMLDKPMEEPPRSVAQPVQENDIPKSARSKRPAEESISVGFNGARRSLRLKEPISSIEPPSKKARFEEPVAPVVLATSESRTSARLVKKAVNITAPPVKQSHRPNAQPPASKTTSTSTITPSSSIKPKRVHLIVRRPPPNVSNPRQLPPPSKHKDSLSSFLSSYTSLNDEDTSAEELRKEATEEAEIRERVECFGRQGRFIPGTEVLFGTEPPKEEYIPPKRVTTDLWDEIVTTIAKVHKKRPRVPAGKQVAGNVARLVQAHWDKQEATKEKARTQEEKKLRKLAEATMKLVTEEWKKAVFHIREKERLKLEEEERKRGREHLDAILDQSGQILQTQQGDLYRSRSQSASASDHLLGWNEGEDEEEDGDGELDESESGEDEDEDIDEAPMEGGEVVREEGEGVVPDGEMASSHGRASSEGDTITSVTDDDDGTANLLSFQTASEVQDQSEDLDDARYNEVPPSDDSVFAVHEMVTNLEDQSPVRRHYILDDEEAENLQPFTESSALVAFANEDPDVPISRAQSPTGSSSMYMSTPAESTMDVEMLDTPMSVAEDDNVPDARLEQDLSYPREVDSEPFSRDEPPEVDSDDENDEVEETAESTIPEYLKPYAVAPVDWDPSDKIKPPLLLRGVLRPYQFSGLEWLASLHTRNVNGILADEMGLGKTIQTISLLAHLACDRGIWGPHLIVVPTSVILNWEMEFKKFLPGFKVLSYHGTTIRRKELRKGWNDKHHFNVCITSYALASRDAHIFKRKPWYYMVLDEAHMIKNFKSQRWNILLMFRAFRRLLLTGTPLQNNLTELWALLKFLMSGSNFANLREFGEWFSDPLEKAIETGNTLDDETMERVSRLHTVLRPYLLRRLKRDVEKELPHKYDHLVLCPLSKRQRFLYDEFMSRAQTRGDLESGIYQKIANILMQLRKVCNHPDLFEVRPIVTSFAMDRSAAADFEIKDLLIRKRFFEEKDEQVNLDVLGLQFIDHQNTPLITALETKRLDATSRLPYISELPGKSPPKDTRTIAGWHAYTAFMERANKIARWSHIGYLNRLRCDNIPIYSQECLNTVQQMSSKILPFSAVDSRFNYMDTVYRVNQCVKSYVERAESMAPSIDRFAFVTPTAVALDMPRIALSGYENTALSQPLSFDDVLHRASVKLQIAFPDPSLLQYDCGKLQELTRLLREKKAGGHRVLIFTQMTRILDLLEIFLSFHGYLYLRLDGATKIEDRQYITERFNADSRIFCFISSSRSGGVGINLTGADTVVFYDSDFNPQMDRQCEDRAHRIGQIRDVHIYRFVSQYTVEEAMLRKANQKRSLDDLVIQKGEFDWRTLFNDEGALTKALGEVEDTEDAIAAAAAAKEAFALEGADEADFGGDAAAADATPPVPGSIVAESAPVPDGTIDTSQGPDEEEEGGTVVDYMLTIVQRDYDFFKDWRL